MTAEDFQKWVRTQMEQTGASYAAARLAVLAQFNLCSRCLLPIPLPSAPANSAVSLSLLKEGCATITIHTKCVRLEDGIVMEVPF